MAAITAIQAPHQPRVDFQLWFYGLQVLSGLQRQQGLPTPEYIARLLENVCLRPQVVDELFVDHLPADPDAVRLVFWRYRFTEADQRTKTGAWWTREQIAETGPISCELPLAGG